ncbi:MAG: helix-turn-helix transcriptional regulator, partial [Candidatus Cloacimonadota bacterium]|nr:helix-turn-helix transcriptional regulator [Candidatus Cloacimonadota bacterium]
VENREVMMDKFNNDWLAMSDDAIIKLIGAYIKHHRIEQNRTQQDVADDAGISRTTLSYLENGDIVNISTLVQVLRALDLLYILDVFTIKNQISPIELAKLEEQRRKRASNKRKNKKPESDW